MIDKFDHHVHTLTSEWLRHSPGMQARGSPDPYAPAPLSPASLSVESRVRMEAGDIHLDDEEIEQHCDETGNDYPGGTGIAPTRSSTRVQRGGVDHPSDEGDVNDG